jgi:hypothetical protein
VRIIALDADGPTDLAAAIAARPDVIAYPKTESAAQMHAALTHWEDALGIVPGMTEILPVCETALGVVDVHAIASGSARIRSAHWRFIAGFVDRRPAMLVYDGDDLDQRVKYFVLLTRAGERVVGIRDFVFARYAMDGAELAVMD